jgi:hypothetical protein
MPKPIAVNYFKTRTDIDIHSLYHGSNAMSLITILRGFCIRSERIHFVFTM